MGVDVNAPKKSGWDAADAEADGWTTADVIAWAKPRAVVYSKPAPIADVPPKSTNDDNEPPAYLDAPPPEPPPPIDQAPPADDAWPFRVLGHDNGLYFYLPRGRQQITRLKASEHRRENLLGLAPLSFWEINWPAKNGADYAAAANSMIRAAEAAGIYAGDDRIRGRGAWLDDGRSVMHLGDRLLVNGESVDVMSHGSKFIYEAARPFPVKTDRIASNNEAHQLLEICKSIRWEQPISAYLLAGWVVTAPVCGILRWRPHIWITGPAGSGKSTVVERIVKPMIQHVGECVAGATSEAGIRQTILRGDARPVVLDEAEPKDPQAQARIKSILDLARVASTGGKLQKGTADQHGREYTVRAMFAFASINPAVEGFADESRVTQLAIAPNENRDDEDKQRNMAHFESLMRRINDTISPDFADAVLMRTLQHLETLRDNVDTFANAAATHLGNMRLGDQIAPMLAGCYLLHSTARITFDAALEWVKKRDWSQHTATGAARDCDRLLQFLMQYQIRFHAGNGGQDSRTLGELLGAATAVGESVIPQDAAYEAILRWGIKPTKDSGVEISTTHNAIKRALQGTEWALGWRRALAAVEGARPIRAVRFGPGSSTPAIWLPLARVLDP